MIIIELVAGSCAEEILFPELPALQTDHDLVEARAVAATVTLPAAIPALIEYARARGASLTCVRKFG